jgi:hypothetical protein
MRQHEHLHAALATHCILGSAAGISGGRPEDVQAFAAARELKLEQCAEQLHRHVLEGQRRPVRQRLDRQPRFEVTQGHDRVGAKDLPRIGAPAQIAQIVARNVVDEQRQDLERQFGVGQPAPARQRCCIDLRVAVRQVQPAIGRQAFEQDLAEAPGRVVSTCTEIPHVNDAPAVRWCRRAPGGQPTKRARGLLHASSVLPCGSARSAPARWPVPASLLAPDSGALPGCRA